jgi:hypothetical protein
LICRFNSGFGAIKFIGRVNNEFSMHGTFIVHVNGGRGMLECIGRGNSESVGRGNGKYIMP